MPLQYKNLTQITNGAGFFNCDLLVSRYLGETTYGGMIHIFPLLVLLILSEHLYLTSGSPDDQLLTSTVSAESDAAYNSMMGLLHVLPSNYDTALVLDCMLAL